VRSTALGWHAIGVEGVGDRLKAQAGLAHRHDALAQLWRRDRKSGTAAWRAPALRLALPPLDLAQDADDPSTRGSPGVKAYVECDEVGARRFKPVNQGGQLAKRASERNQARCDQRRCLSRRDPTKGVG
jgi:hypothetical protein